MKSEQIDYVLEILKFGSINKAAKNLHVTQPNLSSSLKSLEDEIGFKIFDRNRNGVSVTTEGKEFINHAFTIRNAMSQINSISSYKPKTRFNISSQLFSYTLEAFWSFYNKFNNINNNFNLSINQISTVLDDVLTNKSDIGLIYIPSYDDNCINFFSKNGLSFHPISSATISLCVGPNNPLYNKTSIDISDLYQYTLILLDNYYDTDLCKNYVNFLHLNKFANKIIISDHDSYFNTISKKNVVAFSSRFDNYIGETYIQKKYNLNLIPFYPTFKHTLGWIHKDCFHVDSYALEFINILKSIIST